MVDFWETKKVWCDSFIKEQMVLKDRITEKIRGILLNYVNFQKKLYKSKINKKFVLWLIWIL
jgi:hypothetical protein